MRGPVSATTIGGGAGGRPDRALWPIRSGALAGGLGSLLVNVVCWPILTQLAAVARSVPIGPDSAALYDTVPIGHCGRFCPNRAQSWLRGWLRSQRGSVIHRVSRRRWVGSMGS
jgi:hypothetical protein